MKTKYGYLPDSQVHSNETDLVNRIFSLLPAKEGNAEDLDYMFDIVLSRVKGLSVILHDPPELITVMSYLEAARTETQFKLYRKAILYSCSTVQRLVNGGDSNA